MFKADDVPSTLATTGLFWRFPWTAPWGPQRGFPGHHEGREGWGGACTSEEADVPRKVQVLRNPEQRLASLKPGGEATGSLSPSTSGRKASRPTLLKPLPSSGPSAISFSSPARGLASLVKGDLSPFCWLLAVTLQACPPPCPPPPRGGLSQRSPPTESSDSWFFNRAGVNHSTCSS